MFHMQNDKVLNLGNCCRMLDSYLRDAAACWKEQALPQGWILDDSPRRGQMYNVYTIKTPKRRIIIQK